MCPSLQRKTNYRSVVSNLRFHLPLVPCTFPAYNACLRGVGEGVSAGVSGNVSSIKH